MGKRTIYFCDWCKVDARQPEVVNDDWAVDHDGTVLCIACKNERARALAHARHESEKRGAPK